MKIEEKNAMGTRRKKITLDQFWVLSSETNSRAFWHGWYDMLFVSGVRSQNCGRVIFFTPPYFRGRTSFFGLIHLWRPITITVNKSHILESSGRELSHGPSLEICFFEQISRNELYMKNRFLAFFHCRTEKIQTILNRPILKFDALPIAHFEDYVPLFLKHLWKLAISLKLWVPAHFEVGWSRTVSAKIGVFRPLFWRKCLVSSIWPHEHPQVLYMVKRKKIFFTLWSVRFSRTLPNRLYTWPETASYQKSVDNLFANHKCPCVWQLVKLSLRYYAGVTQP